MIVNSSVLKCETSSFKPVALYLAYLRVVSNFSHKSSTSEVLTRIKFRFILTTEQYNTLFTIVPVENKTIKIKMG